MEAGGRQGEGEKAGEVRGEAGGAIGWQPRAGAKGFVT